MRLSGYMVVRLPEFAERAGRYRILRTPSFHGKVYRGVDRLPWEVSVEQYVQPKYRAFFKKLDGSYFGQRMIRLTPDMNDVKYFLDLTAGDQNEVLGVAIDAKDFPHSPQIDCTAHSDLLGCELFAIGEWSPHSAMFFNVKHGEKWISRFNENGLFDDFSWCDSFAKDYIDGSKAGWYEPLADPPQFVRLKVYRIRIFESAV